jgi:hypothetical protein
MPLPGRTIVIRDAADQAVLPCPADHEVVAQAAGAVGERHGDGVGRAGRGGVVGAGLDQAGLTGDEVDLAGIAQHDAGGVVGRAGAEGVVAGSAEQVERAGAGRDAVVAAAGVGQGVELFEPPGGADVEGRGAGVAEDHGAVAGGRAGLDAVAAGAAEGAARRSRGAGCRRRR